MGKNWYASHQKYGNYICSKCAKQRRRDYLEGNENVRTKIYRKEAKRRKKNVEQQMLYHAKKRAKKSGIAFDLQIEDIIVPEVCPIFGIPLQTGTNLERDSSPSLDRIRPEMGYVKGNIQVISGRANRAKSNLSGEELLKLGLWLVYGVHSIKDIDFHI